MKKINKEVKNSREVQCSINIIEELQDALEELKRDIENGVVLPQELGSEIYEIVDFYF